MSFFRVNGLAARARALGTAAARAVRGRRDRGRVAAGEVPRRDVRAAVPARDRGVQRAVHRAACPIPKPQANYLYYDRYVFSEVLPAALLFGAIGLQMIVDVRRSASRRRRGAWRMAIAAGVVVIVAVALVPQVHETRRITKYRLLGSSYHALDRARRADAQPTARARSCTPARASARRTGPSRTRTARSRCRSQQTFNRQVFGIPTEHKVQDVALRPGRGARRARTQRRSTSGYLVRLRRPGQTQHVPERRPHAVRRDRHVRVPDPRAEHALPRRTVEGRRSSTSTCTR